MHAVLYWLDLIGVTVFATSGALVASRKRMDLVGFGMIATVTGIGGGTLRDLLIGRPVFWLQQPVYIWCCVAAASALFIIAPFVKRRYPVLLWADAAGLALFSVLGADIALDAGFGVTAAIVMGVMTATFGGLIRDVLCNEIPLILRNEVYATAAALGAAVYAGLVHAAVPDWAAVTGGVASGFALRALGIHLKLSIPSYRARLGRRYPP